MFLIDKGSKKATKINDTKFAALGLRERYDIQEWIADNPSMLEEGLLIIQKEFDGWNETKERLDLLALDEDGNIVVIENKLDESGSNMVWQALKYVSYCKNMTKDKICDVYQQYLKKYDLPGDAKENLEEHFGKDYGSINLNRSNQRIILVARNFCREVTSTVLWLLDYSIDITCIKLTPYEADGRLIVNPEQILPPKDTKDYQIEAAAKKKEESFTSREAKASNKAIKAFWEKALPILNEKAPAFKNINTPSYSPWMATGLGKKGGGVMLQVWIFKTSAVVEVALSSRDKEYNKNNYNGLLKFRDELDRTFDNKLIWEEKPEQKSSSIYLAGQGENYGWSNEEQWGSIIDHLVDGINKIDKEFRPLMKKI